MSSFRVPHRLSFAPPLFLSLSVAIVCMALLGMALLATRPVQAAPHLVVDENIAIISVTHLDLHANDIISDPFRNVLYATLPSNIGANGNRIVPIDVTSGTLGTPLFVGSEPNHMALSNDGQYLYVGIDGANAVRRVNLISYTAEIQISMGTSESCGANLASDIVVLQDDPHAFAVAKRTFNCSSSDGVTIFDDAIERPDSANALFYQSDFIEPAASPATLYGLNSSQSVINTLVVSPTSVGVITATTFGGSINDIVFHEGLLYGYDGTVIDPLTMTILGSYSGFGPLAADSARGVVYMIEGNSYFPPYGLKVFHQSEYTLLKTLSLVNIYGNPKRLLLLDTNHLALLTDTGDLYLIELGKLIPEPPFFETEPPLTAVEETSYSYVITAADPNYGDVLEISAPVLPSWLSLSNWAPSVVNVYGTPYSNNLGDNVVELLVTDSQGLTSTQRFTITVTANPAYVPPTFTSTPVTTATQGSAYEYQVVTADENSFESREVSSVSLPTWLELSDINFNGTGTARLHGTPAAGDAGEDGVELVVTDSHGLTATQQFTVTVAGIVTDLSPAFGSTPILGAAESITYTYIVTASDPQVGEVMTFSAPTRPGWLTLSPLVNGAARLSGVAANEDIGEHTVTLMVTDSDGLTDTQHFTLTVVGVGQVQGVLFEDANDNGTQDEGEAGIDGATVSLTPAAGSIAAMAIQQAAITTTTTITGSYAFNQVPTGNYTISFDLPGEQGNPPSQPIEVTSNVPTVILPVPVAKDEATIFLPAVKTPKDTNVQR